MSDVTESVDVNVPISTAYDQWTRFESFPQFMDGVEAVKRLDDRRTHWVTDVGGVRREFDAEVTEQHPDERIAWKSIGGEVGHAGVVTFHRLADDQTRVTVQLVWEPHGLVERVGSLLGADTYQVKADTARFKEFIEQPGGATGGWRGDRSAPGTQTTEDIAPIAKPPLTTADQGDIVDVLLAQHEHIKEMFARVHAADGDVKAQLFGRLTELLHAHESGEQQIVHPVTRDSTPDGEQVAAARVQEEREADQAIAELQTLGVGHPGFEMRLQAFHQAVLAHADHEEQDEFPRLRLLPAEDRHAMAEQLHAAQPTLN
jgi:carbon monoxide dehydrogenase subunit G/hemerythrin superfamily protein